MIKSLQSWRNGCLRSYASTSQHQHHDLIELNNFVSEDPTEYAAQCMLGESVTLRHNIIIADYGCKRLKGGGTAALFYNWLS